MTRIYCCTVVLLLAMLPVLLEISTECAGSPNRDRVTIEGEGEAAIQTEDLPRARNDALEDALHKAFENALAEILPLDLSLAMRQDIVDQLAPRLKRYLLQYRVLSEMPALQVYFLNVEATFSVPLIRDDLAKIGFAWTEEETGESVELFVRVEGVPSFGWYQQVLQVFEQMVFVNRATPFEAFGTSLVLRLEVQRDLEGLLEAISSLRDDEFAFRVEQVRDQEITVSLVPMND
jgi:hypothetical protein